MLVPELLSTVEKYLDRVISLEELEDWLVPRLPLFFRAPYSSELVTEIEVGLADMSNHARSEDEFRSLLKTAIEKVDVQWFDYPSQTVATYVQSANQASPNLQYTNAALVYALP